MKQMKGVFPALLTPFGKDGSINEVSLKKLVEFNVQKGVNGFYVGGSSGEGMVMSSEERKRVFRIVKEAAGDSVVLIAHCGTTYTQAAIDMAKEAEYLGYDAVSAVAPFYYSFSYDEIRRYYDDVVSSVNLPMVIYNYPDGSGFTLTPERAAEIFEDERFVGIKHTSPDFYALERFKSAIKRPVVVFNGFDQTFLAGLAMGADGAIGSTYNFMADKFLRLYDEFNKGNVEKAREIQKEANEIIAALLKYGVLPCIKALLTFSGLDMGVCRRPFLPPSKRGTEIVRSIAERLALKF